MRIVLDTNVVLSALLWRGTPYRLLDAIRQRSSTQLYSSATLLEKLADVLTRPSATKRLALIEKTAATVLADYVEVIELVAPTTVPRVVPGDIDDDQVIAAAVAAQADLIVSGDRKHLLPLCSHAGIAIIDAARHCAGSSRSHQSLSRFDAAWRSRACGFRTRSDRSRQTRTGLRPGHTSDPAKPSRLPSEPAAASSPACNAPPWRP